MSQLAGKYRVQYVGSTQSLRGQYRIIGKELLLVEASRGFFRFATDITLKRFREGVSFISVEVLESYLDDLMDLTVSDQDLFIERPRIHQIGWCFAVVGILLALVAGVYLASNGTAPIFAIVLTLLCALPFLLVFQHYYFHSPARRLSFAKLVSQEIARRRGSNFGSRIVTRDMQERLFSLLGDGHGATHGAAYFLWH